MSDTVTIQKEEYLRLKKCNVKLRALEWAGVDNWEGYSYAMSDALGESVWEAKEQLEEEIISDD